MTELIKKLISRIPPSIRVLLVALIGFGLFVGARLYQAEQVEAEVNYSERYSDPRARRKNQDSSKILTADLEGPVPRMARRLRDASGLALALGYARLGEATSNHPAPATVDELINIAVARDLLPPGVALPEPLNRKSGVLLGQDATIYVRYRPAPFGVEVVSIGNTKDDGAAILIRLPIDETSDQQNSAEAKSENPGAALFTLDTTGAVTIPAPFASPGSMLAAGWQTEKFRSLEMSQERVNELTQWLRQNKNK